MSIPTMEGVTAKTVITERITTRVLFTGPDSGAPVLFLHGNASSATWWEETMLAMPEGYRGIAPDQRGYGDADPERKIDATRGAGDLADDAWAVWQFDRPDLQEGIVLALRRPASPFSSGCFRLHGLDPQAHYVLADLDTDSSLRTTGRSLIQDGLRLSPASHGVVLNMEI